MQTQFATLAKSMEAARTGGNVTSNASAYTQQLAQVTKLRDGIKEVTDAHGNITKAAVPGFNQLMQATGAWNVQTVKAVTSSQALTKSLMDGKLQMSQLTQGYGKFMTTLRQVANEQQKLRNSTAIQWTQNSNGKSVVDLYSPTSAITSANVRIGTYMTALKSAGQAVQDWGKNTQWAGRQITAGLVMPVALASAGLIKLANDADKQLTRITKVMNTQTVSSDPLAQQQSNIQQYAATRAAAMQTGIDMAKQYGAALTDTLGLEADLAAVGLQGNRLQQTTSQVTRFATLGEIDYNTALATTLSLMNAYKMNTTQLGDAFNYMNALENNTSLSMKDFATAIPIASNAMAQLGVSFKDFGTLMVAGKAGGVDSTQMAQSLKSATARILTPTKNTVAAFDELGIDINKEVSQSDANLMTLLKDLGPKMAGADPIKRMTAIKQLFGTYQYGKQSTVMSNILDAMNNPDDPNNQTAVAIKTAQQTNDQNKQIADQEIKQFQQSSSGKLAIATQTMKAQLTQLGAPLLGILTPILSGLTGLVSGFEKVVKVLGGLPGPIKTILGWIGGAALATGPLMMLVGIFANFGGFIAKFIAALKLAGRGFQVFDAQMAADEQLQKTALQTKDKSAQATANLALRMQELVDIMQTRMEAQTKLNAMIEEGAKAEADAALASEKSTTAQIEAASAGSKRAAVSNEVVVAEEKEAAATEVDVKAARDLMIALNDLTAARLAANPNGSQGLPMGPAQYYNNKGITLAAANTGVDPKTLEAESGIAPFGSRGWGAFAVGTSGTANLHFDPTQGPRANARMAALSGMLDQNGYNASLGYGTPMYAATGTTGRGFTVGSGSAARDTLVGLRGPSGTQNAAIQRANIQRMIAASQRSAAGASAESIAMNGFDRTAAGSYSQAVFGQLGSTSVKVDMAQATTAARKIVTQAEASLMDELVAMSGNAAVTSAPGMRAKMATVARKINPFASSAADPSYAMLSAGAARNLNGGITEAGVATKAAAEESAVLAKNSEKAGISWGKMAGNATMLVMGASMLSSMSDSSGNIATNLMQGTLAFTMIAPVIGQAVKKMQELRAANAAIAVEGKVGTSLIGSGFSKIGQIGKSAFSQIASAAKFLFTTGPGLLITALAGIALAFYTINAQLTKAEKTQEKINQSTTAWQSILGYTSTNTLKADGTVAQGANAYLARANAVKTLTEQNQSLVDSLGKAKDASNGLDKVYSMAANEALKVKVDGGSAAQAQMAFQVAAQASGLNTADLNTLNLKFSKVNLDDPGVLKQQLNDQIAAALKPQDNQDAQGGWFEQHWNSIFGQKSAGSLGRLFGGNGYSGLSDDAKAAGEAAGNAVWNSLAEGIKDGDSDQVKSAMSNMDDAINKEFADGFGRLRGDGDNAATFKALGVSNMTQLRQAMLDATDAQKKGTASDVQKKLLGAMGDIQKSDAYQGFQDQWKNMLKQIGQGYGLTGKGLDDFVNKTLNSTQVQKFFNGAMQDAQGKAVKLGDAYQNAADGAATLSDAMNTDGAIATGAQYAKEMQDAYGGTIQSYVGQMNTAWQQASQAAQKAIQDAGDAQVKGLQDQQKAQDKAYDDSDKAITAHYKDLANQYDANVKAKQDEAKAETDAIQTQIDALKKSDTTRQDLFNNEMTRLQRLAQAQSNNIDFNAALNSGNLDEAARLYANNAAQTQQNMLDDAQKSAEATSQAQQDALSQQIQNINDAKDAYVQAQQDKKSALADFEQAEHDSLAVQKQNYDDAMQAQITASQQATAASIAASNDRYAKDKAAIDQQVAAITAFVPQSVDQVHTQIAQIDKAYGGYGDKLTYYGGNWAGIIQTDLNDNISKAARNLQNDVAWSQMGSWIQTQLDNGADFTLDEALKFLQTGVWPGTPTPFNGPVAPGAQRPMVDSYTGKVIPGMYAPGKAHGGLMEDVGPRYTGDGTKFQPAGIVHAGEFVFPQEAVQRLGVNTLSRLAFAPDIRNALSGSGGYAGGGLVIPKMGAGLAPAMAMGAQAVKAAAFRGAVMRAVAQKMMDTVVIDRMGGGDAAGIVSAAIGAEDGGQTWKALDVIRQKLFPNSVRTDGFRPGAHDMHGMGDAIDIGVAGNLQSGLMPIAARLAALFPNSSELIHNPNGSIKNGKAVSPNFWGSQVWSEHANHVHWGMTPQALAASQMGGLNIAAAPGDLSGNQAIVKNLAASMFGWQGSEWNALYNLVNKESGFRNTAQNPTSTAFGMFQFLNDTWKNYGIAKTADPTQQTIGGLKYINARYTDPIGAWAHELKYNWYDQGGWLQNGGIGINQSGKPEPVFTDSQWTIMKSLVGSSVNNIGLNAAGIDSGSGKAYNIEKVEIDMTGSMINGQVDFEQGVYNALVKLDDKMGRSRTVS